MTLISVKCQHEKKRNSNRWSFQTHVFMARCEDSSRIQDDLIRAKRYNERDRFLIRAMPRTIRIRVIITILAFKPMFKEMFQTDVSNNLEGFSCSIDNFWMRTRCTKVILCCILLFTGTASKLVRTLTSQYMWGNLSLLTEGNELCNVMTENILLKIGVTIDTSIPVFVQLW